MGTMKPNDIFINILLYDLEQPCLILPIKTGVMYQNQTAGTMCGQQTLEGILVPLCGIVVSDDVINVVLDSDGLTHKQADLLDKEWLNTDFMRMSVDRDYLNESQEAWIFVKVVLEVYAGPAVLTWENSD